MPFANNIDSAIIIDDDPYMSEPYLSAQTPSPLSSPEFSDASGVSTPLLAPNTLTRPPPQLTPEDEAKVLTFFRGYALSQRSKDVMSWVWNYGLDIQDDI